VRLPSDATGGSAPATCPRSCGGQLPRLIDIVMLSEVLGVSERHVRRLVADRRIPFVKVGHYVRFDHADVIAWIDRQAVRVAEDRVPGSAGRVSHRFGRVPHQQTLAPKAMVIRRQHSDPGPSGLGRDLAR
jgi:excisionase family DNA binding protein